MNDLNPFTLAWGEGLLSSPCYRAGSEGPAPELDAVQQVAQGHTAPGQPISPVGLGLPKTSGVCAAPNSPGPFPSTVPDS